MAQKLQWGLTAFDLRPVKNVTYHRAAEMRQMHPQLMLAPGNGL